ncbi:tellurium resistance protein TerC [Chryseobacterium sp. S0630]|uniref:MauE/DoxX family redox-associated membrane protein n=1 Tax=Chryseobacterium sp. S0630 TaxID=2957803 RepID=UPI0020A1D85E|nr:MauE/DoxX family redox-associated membrane protein [Chryseobacterium sp. S0630]MCP1297959.1 tellurium resistance protein TerC [Chryseobacterium sp. S0630]
MRKLIEQFPTFTAYFFVLLLMYASVSKILDFENFQVQIAQSPLLTAYAGVVSYLVIIIELLIVILLLIPRFRGIGLFSSLGIMTSFTVYIYMILHYSESVPCSCGGILEKMSWDEHLFFNLICVLLAVIALICFYYNQKKNSYKVYTKLSATILTGSFIVILLSISSEHTVKRENKFTRRFLIHPLIKDKTLQLDNEHYYFAGNNKLDVFFGNTSTPLVLASVDNSFNSLQKMQIYPDQTDFTYTNLQLRVKDSDYYLYDGSVPIIYKGKTGKTAAHTISHNEVYFNQLAVIDSSNFAVRIRSSKTGEYELGLLTLTGYPHFTHYDRLLEKQIDGIFDADGQLVADVKKNSITYMYAYRNQFLVMNDELKLKSRFKTIDTISRAQIEPVKLANGSTKLKSRPLKVNSVLAANGPLLFNRSHLMGKHESAEQWRNAVIVDIYRTDKQEYVGSFYLDHINNKPVSQIMVTDNYLYTIAGKKLVRYQYRTSNVKYFTTGEAENLKKE